MGIQPHAVGVVVHDMSTSLAFYRALGLAIPDGEERSPQVEFATGGYHIGFTTEELVRRSGATWVEPAGQRVMLALKLDSPAKVDSLFARMAEAGNVGLASPWNAFWGQRYAFLQDPDRNRVDIFADLPTDADQT